MWWFTKRGSQGLQKSMLSAEHLYIGKTKLTLRDQHVIHILLEMITHPTHPRSILGLQECGVPFLKELRLKLPSNFVVLANGGNGVIIDADRFEIIQEDAVKIFSNEPKRTIQNIVLQDIASRHYFRLINVHIPGDPDKPGKIEFTNYLANSFDSSITTIAMGDMNFNELEMKEALTLAFLENASPFSLYAPYSTNVSPDNFHSKAIDHFLVYLSSQALEVELNIPDELFLSLQSSVTLLNH